jgi:hypothetical protein
VKSDVIKIKSQHDVLMDDLLISTVICQVRECDRWMLHDVINGWMM